MAHKENVYVNEQKDFNNITAWHKAGITGKGITVWNTEGGGDHSEIVSRRVWDAAPDANIIAASLEMAYDNEKVSYAIAVYNGVRYEIEDFIKKFNVRVITRSIGGGTRTGSAASKFWAELRDKYKLVFFNSGGNEAEEGCGGSLPEDIALFIGACNLINGKPIRASYSSIGPELDFTNFTGVWSGTSFAAPYSAGMAALLLQARPNWTQADVVAYFKEHAMDLGTEGRDDKHGEGLIMLGEPLTTNTIRIPIGEKFMYVNGVAQEIDQPAFVDPDTDRTLVPIRAVAEAFGAKVEWDGDNNEVLIEL